MPMKVRYTVIDGEIIAEKRNGVRKQYVPDPLGSTVAMLDNTQTQTDTFSYWPYGEVASRTGTTPTPFQYVGTAGYYKDGSSRGYVRTRTLDNVRGRWQTEDPIGFHSNDINLYRYVENFPISVTDPSGLSWCCFQLGPIRINWCCPTNNPSPPPKPVPPKPAPTPKFPPRPPKVTPVPITGDPFPYLRWDVLKCLPSYAAPSLGGDVSGIIDPAGAAGITCAKILEDLKNIYRAKCPPNDPTDWDMQNWCDELSYIINDWATHCQKMQSK